MPSRWPVGLNTAGHLSQNELRDPTTARDRLSEQRLATIGKPVSRRARNSGIMKVAGAQAPRLPSSFLHLCYVPLAPMEVFR